MIRFREGGRGSVYETLSAIKQVGAVSNYVRDFEVLVGQTTRIPEEQLLGYFMAGLQEEVSDHVRPHDPQDLMVAMRVARDVETLCNHSKIGDGQTTRNLDSWGGMTKVVSGSEHNREIQG